MGLFSRRRDDASTETDEPALDSDDGSSESTASGPWDLHELPEDQEEVPRIDLGSLRIPAVDGMQLRMEQGPEGTITAVVLALGGSALELRVSPHRAPPVSGTSCEATLPMSSPEAAPAMRRATGSTVPSWSPTYPCAAPTARRRPARSASWASTGPAGS